MVWRNVVAGFLISGFVIVFVPQSVWNALFLGGDPVWAAAENALTGAAVAVISFTGSIGNVLFAALEIVPSVVEGESAISRDYVQLDYTFWLNFVALALSAFLYGTYRRGLGARGESRDAV